MQDMRIFTSSNPTTIEITGLCTGVTKLCNEVIYVLENALILQGFLSGSNIRGDSKTLLTTSIINIASQIKSNQIPFLSVLPPTEQLSSIQINSMNIDETSGNLTAFLNIISVAGATAPATVSLGV